MVQAPGNNTISLAGTLVPQTDPNNLALVSELFTNYLNSVESPVIATGVSTIQADGSIISWLSQGLQALHLTVPFKPLVPINPIQSISIGDLGLRFTEENPWSPTLESNSVNATLSKSAVRIPIHMTKVAHDPPSRTPLWFQPLHRSDSK